MGETDTADVDSLNMDELGLGAKMFLMMLSKFGVNAPTAVTPKVLSEAQVFHCHPPLCIDPGNYAIWFPKHTPKIALRNLNLKLIKTSGTLRPTFFPSFFQGFL